MSVTNGSSLRVGSFGLWLFLRALELFLAICALKAAQLVGFTSNWSLALYGVLGYSLIAMDSHVYGEADERGLTYRRYLLKKFVPWEKLEEVRWKGIRDGYELVLAGGPRWRRTAIVPGDQAYQSLKALIRDRLHPKKPELVEWLEQRIALAHDRRHAPGSESLPAGPAST